jgi:hypothetical protein
MIIELIQFTRPSGQGIDLDNNKESMALVKVGWKSRSSVVAAWSMLRLE